MQKLKRRIQKYPIVFLFFFLLFGFSILDPLWPKREQSELENRPLAQYPTVTVNSLISNQWMKDYEAYVKDQFALRDTWINIKSFTENTLLKTENNGILLGKDHFLFSKDMALDSEKQYALNLTALLKFAQRHQGNTQVMIVPSPGVILNDKLPAFAPLRDENAYLDDIFAQLNAEGVLVHDVRDTLAAHSNEYIYYRTDHHWTSYGAYLAYSQFAQTNSLAPFDTATASAVEVADFYGTHYSKARNAGVVTDTITYYDLPNMLTVQTMNEIGKVTDSQTGTLYDTGKFNERDKYAAFLRGNNGYSELQGNGKGRLLVVKDSYANSFVPYLVADYETIGIVDYRMNPLKLDKIMLDGGYDTVLFLYSFDAFTSDLNFAAKIASGLKES